MMWKIETLAVIFVLFILCNCSKKKEITKAAADLLEAEEKRLLKEHTDCPLQKLSKKSVDDLRLRQEVADEKDLLLACVLKLIQSSQSDGWLWSVLGDAYSKKGSKHNNHANICFKQALKFTGKLSGSFIKEWHFIGPFIIGKIELDGDPLEKFGSIRNASRQRLQKDISYFSELVPEGKIKWKIFQQQSDRGVQISPQINWNDLVSSLGSLGMTEWQGWVVGEFAVNEKDHNVVIQCLGVHTVYLDAELVLTGDVYHRDQYWFSSHLTRGIHTVYIRLRTKLTQTFKCSLKISTASLVVNSPSFLPDLLDGYLFSSYISIPVSNHHHSKWLQNIRVTLISQSDGYPLKVDLPENVNTVRSIAPGQTRPVIIQLSAADKKVIDPCRNIDIDLKVSASDGHQPLTLTLRCRGASQSFLFMFLDHDGSVQHGAAIQPLGNCDSQHSDMPVCPVVLTLHGTTVPPQNQADSYKHMVNGEFIFGAEGAWLLAPTRHGAHNWEGPGALTAMTALQCLSNLTRQHDWLRQKASADHVIYAGHSMGGHGALHLATHYPDTALALIPLAGWIKKEEYGDSNLFFKHDISTSHTDPAIKAVMEACIAENDADRHVTNLQGIPVLMRIGANDRTVHPFFVRRMFRLLREVNVRVIYTELKDKEHWWWDTWETNDGGAVNDKQMRDFVEKYSKLPVTVKRSCKTQEEEGCSRTDMNQYAADANWLEQDSFTYVTMNPAFGGGVKGLRILQQTTPYRLSKIEGRLLDGEVLLSTTNVARFSITEPNNRPVSWQSHTVKIDDQLTLVDEMVELTGATDTHLCKKKGRWGICREPLYSMENRGPATLGPARRIAENKFVIVTGSQSTESTSRILLNYAVYIANLFYLTSDTIAPVMKDTDVSLEELGDVNVIVVGGPDENSLASHFLSGVPVTFIDGTIELQSCRFSHSRTGLLTLTPHGDLHLAMVLMALSLVALKDVVSLATPTIPPMTRSPFSNLLPDYVITGPEFGATGPGGYLCAGFWGNHWEYRPELASCVCQE